MDFYISTTNLPCLNFFQVARIALEHVLLFVDLNSFTVVFDLTEDALGELLERLIQ